MSRNAIPAPVEWNVAGHIWYAEFVDAKRTTLVVVRGERGWVAFAQRPKRNGGVHQIADDYLTLAAAQDGAEAWLKRDNAAQDVTHDADQH